MVAENHVREENQGDSKAYINTILVFTVVVLILILAFNRKWVYTKVFPKRPHNNILSVKTDGVIIHDAQSEILTKQIYCPDRIFTFEASDSEDELRLQIQQAALLWQHLNRHNSVAEIVHQQLPLNCELINTSTPYSKYNTKAVMESDRFRLYWDHPILREIMENDGVGCHYEEKNEIVRSIRPIEVDVIETALRETALRDTSIRLHDTVQEVALRESKIDEYRNLLEHQSSFESDGLAHNDTSLLCANTAEESAGTIEVSILYDAPVRCMTVHVLQARDLLGHTTERPLYTQVRVLLLPNKKQKFKTKIRFGEHPQFMESFVFHKVNPEDVHGVTLRLRLYACSRVRRVKPLSEALLSLADLNLEVENSLWLLLVPKRSQRSSKSPKPAPSIGATTPSGTSTTASVSKRETPDTPLPPPLLRRDTSEAIAIRRETTDGISIARSDSASSCGSARSAAPELLLGLAYNSSTGHLNVEIIKGTHFRKLSGSKSPDTYVKLCLVSPLGHEMARGKTSTRRARSNPLFKELFIFQVALYQLSEVTLCVSVWCRRNVKKNEMVGWCSLGSNASGRMAAEHWQHACAARGLQVQRWHAMRDS